VQTEQLLFWSDMSDSEHTISGSDEVVVVVQVFVVCENQKDVLEKQKSDICFYKTSFRLL